MHLRFRRLTRNRFSPFLMLGLLCCIVLAAYGATVAVQAHHKTAAVTSHKSAHFLRQVKFIAATINAQKPCATLVDHCYTPQQVRQGYNVTPLLKAGYTGAGQSIVIVDSFGSPTLTHDLHMFDQTFGLPDPPALDIRAPLGTVPFDSKNTDHVAWAQETTLDVEWAHVIAPSAKIVVLTSPVAETEGVQGLPEFLQLEEYAVKQHLGTIFSQSWAATEETLFTSEGKDLMESFEKFFQDATLKQHMTFLAAAGDFGSTNPDLNMKAYPYPTVNYPASSPWVTTVGGTSLYLDNDGKYRSETTWNSGIGAASGGGISKYFSAPDYQNDYLPTANLVQMHGYRAIPDVAYNADPHTGVPIYISSVPTPGFYVFGGTSAGTPQWAGLVAIANQMAGGNTQGFLNPRLYAIGSDKQAGTIAFHDIMVGDNSQGSIPGYEAHTGWDAVTGWGSPQASELLKRLLK